MRINIGGRVRGFHLPGWQNLAIVQYHGFILNAFQMAASDSCKILFSITQRQLFESSTENDGISFVSQGFKINVIC